MCKQDNHSSNYSNYRNMGNKRNKSNPHASRGYYKRKKGPACRPKQDNTDTTPQLQGCRIINLEKLASFIEDVSTHSQSCQHGTVSLVGETYCGGLASILSAKCSGCRIELAFPTSSKVSSLGGARRWECNMAAVWGQMVTGGGHAPLEEAMSVLGIPVMAKKSFIATEKDIAQQWWLSLEASMQEAAKEEKKLAIERGSFHEGIPVITVILDGGWCKRTHKHSYNAKSGVAIIIGSATGKLLHVGVRNKYCSVCAQANKENRVSQEHNCHKNWDGPSSSMETDIIVQGFKEAETKYGLRYTTFIGDGDSSTYLSLIAGVPGWGHAIKKCECANHAIKCYRGSLEKLVGEKTHYKGKGRLTESMCKRLTRAARCAIKMRSTLTDRTAAVRLLQQDLLNGPYHYFGDHSNCSADYCRVAQSKHSNTELTPPSDISITPPSDTGLTSSNHSTTTATDTITDFSTVAGLEQRLWEEALSEENLEDVRSIPSSAQLIDREMMCDIQCLVGRLAGQLIGEKTYNSMHTIHKYYNIIT